MRTILPPKSNVLFEKYFNFCLGVWPGTVFCNKSSKLNKAKMFQTQTTKNL